jgi:surface protein
MFNGAAAFNQDISSWNINSVANMSNMFSGASVFNADISSWDVTSVTAMGDMFSGAAAFNRDISGWNVGNATIGDMFNGATAFNQDLSGWCVSGISSAPRNFATGSAFVSATSKHPSWGMTVDRCPFRLATNGVTVLCNDRSNYPAVAVGDTGVVSGTTYTKRITGITPTTARTPTDFAINGVQAFASPTSGGEPNPRHPVWNTTVDSCFLLATNGVTVTCEGAIVGGSGQIGGSGTTYTKRSTGITSGNAATTCTSG